MWILGLTLKIGLLLQAINRWMTSLFVAVGAATVNWPTRDVGLSWYCYVNDWLYRPCTSYNYVCCLWLRWCVWFIRAEFDDVASSHAHARKIIKPQKRWEETTYCEDEEHNGGDLWDRLTNAQCGVTNRGHMSYCHFNVEIGIWSSEREVIAALNRCLPGNRYIPVSAFYWPRPMICRPCTENRFFV